MNREVIEDILRRKLKVKIDFNRTDSSKGTIVLDTKDAVDAIIEAIPNNPVVTTKT